jgi:hypothetical protein
MNAAAGQPQVESQDTEPHQRHTIITPFADKGDGRKAVR